MAWNVEFMDENNAELCKVTAKAKSTLKSDFSPEGLYFERQLQGVLSLQ